MSPERSAPDRRQGWDPDYSGPERRGRAATRRASAADLQERYIAQQFGHIEDRLAEGDGRMQALEIQLQALRGELATNTTKTEDIHAILVYARSGLKVLGVIGAVVKWCGGIAAGVGAIWGLWHAYRNGGPKL